MPRPRQPRPARAAPAKGAGSLRIIAGEHRGRRLPIPDLPGLRPTADRVRETLFNWLAPWLPGARCLDLFAGSGALGLEAVSRGAALVLLVERAAPAVRQLQANRETLRASTARIIEADALELLRGEDPSTLGGPFDIVFLDPPFADALLDPALRALCERPWLAAGALVYWECEAGAAPPALPDGWQAFRERTAGQVRFGLARVA